MDKKDFTIIYLFLALEGKVTVREHNLFSEIMRHDGFDDADIKEVGRNTMSIISGAYSEENREALIRHQFEKYSKDISKGNSIHNRTVLWTLINLAFSDASYSKAEQRLVHLYAKNMSLDKSYVLEMEDTARTLLAIINERNFLKKSSSTSNQILKELDTSERVLKEHISVLILLG